MIMFKGNLHALTEAHQKKKKKKKKLHRMCSCNLRVLRTPPSTTTRGVRLISGCRSLQENLHNATPKQQGAHAYG